MNNKDIIQLIVREDKSQEAFRELMNVATVKYELPMMKSYVIELERKHWGHIKEWKRALELELDTSVTAKLLRARDMIDVDWAHGNNIYGQGIGVAVIDTGISPHVDFFQPDNRIVAFMDVVNKRKTLYDDCGHGTHVSGIIGGSGVASNGKYKGIAPRCNIISVKVLNSKGNGNVSDVLMGLQWIVENKERYNIRVVNISVGASKNRNDEHSNLIKAVEAVWDNGIVVVVAAGNNGPRPMSIGAPGNSRKIITVGAVDDNETVELAGKNIKDYSGRGPTVSCIKKPDIVAPGSNIISCNGLVSKGVLAGRRMSNTYTSKSGTSMATPVVTGAIALLLSKYPKMTPKDVKMRLRDSAVDLGYPWSKQGWGLINVKSLILNDRVKSDCE